MMSFHLTLFPYNVKEEKIHSRLCGVCILPTSSWVFSGDSGFPPHPKEVNIRLTVVFKLSQYE